VLDVKICGLKSREALDAAITKGASHIGFVFFAKSPRYVTLAQAAALREHVGERAKTVAVVVDADNLMLDELTHQVKPDMLQLHGQETPRRVAEIKKRYNLPAIKAIAVHDRSDLHNLVPYRGIVDRILFDAKAPKGAALPGGNGISFDWRVLEGLDLNLDYMLSGGLNAQNIRSALALAKPGGVDVSSGVESAPGVKDVALIDGFFSAINEVKREIVQME